MCPDFKPIVEASWMMAREGVSEQCYIMDKWHYCITKARQTMRGWDMQRRGEQKRVKLELLNILEEWDKIVEEREMKAEEWQKRYEAESTLKTYMPWR